MTRRAGMTPEEFFEADLAVAPLGFCQCGCGELTEVSAQNSKRDGYVKGLPRLFRHGHIAPDRQRRIVLDEATGCWNMSGSTDPDGYIVMRWKGQQYRAHRFFYEWIEETTIPDDLSLDHLCRNKRCINPEHLEIVSTAVNTRRGLSAKLTEADVEVIRTSTDRQRVLAERFGVSQATISRAKRGESWA